jgi:hypothetical protein
MSQRLSVSVAACPFQMRWLHAGGDLSRPDHIHQCTDRAFMHSTGPPRFPVHRHDLPCVQTCSWHRAGAPTTIEIGAHIKSP